VVRTPRTKMPTLAPEERKQSFAEIESGFSEEMARAEAERCLSCGCQDVFECRLRQLATEYHVDGAHYAGRRRHLPIRKDEHSYILRDPNKCILCGRCVRICNEVQGISVLGFTQRGFDTVIEPAIGLPLAETLCESCGQCVSTCPTGALTAKVRLPKPGPWQLDSVPSVCPHCGIGCNLQLKLIGDEIVEVTSPIDSQVNNGNLCKRGSLSHRHIQELKRLKTPLIKHDNRLVAASWDEAIDLAGRGLRLIKERSGSHRLAVLSSARLTNEESYLAQKLARAALDTNNISCLTPSVLDETLAKIFGINASTCSYDDLLTSDLILLFGCDLTQDYPIIASKIRKAVGRGSKLVTISPGATIMDSLTKVDLKVNPKTTLALLRAMLNYIITYDLVDGDFVPCRTTGFEDFAREMRKYPLKEIADTFWVKPSRIIDAIHLYLQAKRPVIVVNANTIKPAELALISDLALITGNVGRDGAGMIVLRTPGNAQGLIDMGVGPDYLPGQLPITDAAARQKFEAAWHRPLPLEKGRDAIGIIEGVEKGDIQGILVLGIDAAGEMGSGIFEVPIFSVLMDTELPEAPPYPDVVLPGATFAESEGTFTNCERRIQHLRRAIPPPSGKENWEVISLLASAMGYPMEHPSISSISREIAELAPLFKAGICGEQWPFSDDGRFNSPNGLAQLRLPEPFQNLEAMEALGGLLY
jgi:formate dehydrogenase major subunit